MLQRILILVLLFISQDFIAQNVVFDLNGRINFAQPDESTVTDTVMGYSSRRLDDTTVVRTYSNYVQEITSDYISNKGYEVNGMLTIKISNRLSVRTGIGVQFGSFSYGKDYEIVDLQVTHIDTLYQEITDPFPDGGSSSCDVFENSYSDVASGISNRIHQEMINLSVPAEIGYDIIPGKLVIRAGGYFHTPLYAAAKRSFITLEHHTVDTMTICRWVRVDEKNTATTGTSNFQWGISSWLDYQLLPYLQLEVGVRQQMNDVYAKQEVSFFSSPGGFRPMTFSAGLSYRLYKGISTD